MEPLEKRHIPSPDKASTVPALHEVWVQDIQFLTFEPLPRLDSSDDILEWLNALEIIATDLEILLCLPCNVFWSQVLCDESLQACLDSYLKFAPRDVDGQVVNTKIEEALSTLHTLYFRVFLRLMTCKESKKDFFTPEAYGNILYEKFVLDVPKLIDLCTLYCMSNEELLRKMVENAFKCQPKYADDVKASIPALSKVFQDLIDKVNGQWHMKTKQLDGSDVLYATSVDEEFIDLCLFSSDVCHSLYCFLHIYPCACHLFHEAHFYKILCTFYDDVLKVLLKQYDRFRLSDEDAKRIYKKLTLAQEECVKMFRAILFNSTINKELVEIQQIKGSKIGEFCDILVEYIGEVWFMGMYESMYPVSKDVHLLHGLGVSVDNDRISFIRDGLLLAKAQYDEEIASSTRKETVTDNSNESNSSGSLQAEYIEGAAGGGSNQSSSTQQIKELFPDLGDGFIEACLHYYKSHEEVVNALLEDNLPPSLRSMDRKLEVLFDENSLLNQRKNVYDNDEFDVFRRKAIDTSKVHRGKKVADNNVPDDAVKDKIKQLTMNYNDMSIRDRDDDVIAGGFDDLLYDDEYDDTYDTNEVGADDADEELELMGRKMVVPRALGGVEVENDDEDDVGVNNASTNDKIPVSKDHSGPPRHPQRVYDVKGKPKGQGQSTDVLKNRRNKTQNKARGANHNRKARSDYKMSRGMF